MKKNLSNIILLGIMALSIIGTAILYDKLPAQVPSHWNIHGEVDDYQSRVFVYFTALLPILLYGLMRFLPKIDPKRESYEKHKKAYDVFILVLTIFLVSVHWMTLSYALGNEINVGSFMNLGMGIMFMVLGNYMSQIRHNYLFGIKTPWTLASESVWKKTHRAGGYVFFIIGLLFILSGFVDSELSYYLVIGSVIASTLGLTIYSYFLYKREKRL